VDCIYAGLVWASFGLMDEWGRGREAVGWAFGGRRSPGPPVNLWGGVALGGGIAHLCSMFGLYGAPS